MKFYATSNIYLDGTRAFVFAFTSSSSVQWLASVNKFKYGFLSHGNNKTSNEIM